MVQGPFLPSSHQCGLSAIAENSTSLVKSRAVEIGSLCVLVNDWRRAIWYSLFSTLCIHDDQRCGSLKLYIREGDMGPYPSIEASNHRHTLQDAILQHSGIVVTGRRNLSRCYFLVTGSSTSTFFDGEMDGRLGKAHGLDEPLVGKRDVLTGGIAVSQNSLIAFVGRNPTSLHLLGIDRELLATGGIYLQELYIFVVMQKQTSCTLFFDRRITLLHQESRTSANFHFRQEEG